MKDDNLLKKPLKKVENVGSLANAGELVAKITAQFSALIRDEIKYVTLQIKSKVTKIGVGAVLIIVAVVLALYMLGILFMSAGFALAQYFAVWFAFLLVAAGIFAVILILLLIALISFKSSKKHTFDIKAGVTEDIESLKKGLEK